MQMLWMGAWSNASLQQIPALVEGVQDMITLGKQGSGLDGDDEADGGGSKPKEEGKHGGGTSISTHNISRLLTNMIDIML